MSDEHRILQLKSAPDPYHIFGITVELSVFRRLVRGEVGSAGADMIEKNDAEIRFEGASYRIPHVLIAAEAVREHHGARARARDVHVIAAEHHVHLPSTGVPGQPSGQSSRVGRFIGSRIGESHHRLSKLSTELAAPGHIASASRPFQSQRRGTSAP